MFESTHENKSGKSVCSTVNSSLQMAFPTMSSPSTESAADSTAMHFSSTKSVHRANNSSRSNNNNDQQ